MELTPGELSRAVEALTKAVERVEHKLDSLNTQYVPRETFEMAIGSFRMEITRLNQTAQGLESDFEGMKEKSDARFRSTVTLAISAFVAPIVTGIIVLTLTLMVQK